MIGALIAQVRDGVRRIWCFKWLAFSVAAVLTLMGAPIVMSLPKVYEAWAQIYVAKETPLGSAAQGVSLVGQSYGDPYVVEKTLLNDDSVKKLLYRLDPASRSLPPGRTALAVQALKGKIRVSPSIDDGFFELHVVDSDPVRARNTVQWLIDEFMSRNLARNQDALSDATRFLDQQMAIYRQMLDQSNIRLETFRAQHPGVAATVPSMMVTPSPGGQMVTRRASAQPRPIPPRSCLRRPTSGSPSWTPSSQPCAANTPTSILTSSRPDGSRPWPWRNARRSPCGRRRPLPPPRSAAFRACPAERYAPGPQPLRKPRPNGLTSIART
jgi:hypothetical protein